MSCTYWKISVFDEEKIGCLVKACNLKEQEAKDLVKELSSMGVMARASKHINPKKEYFYGK